MSSEALQVENGKRERKGWRGLLYPLTQKRAVTALRPGISRVNQKLREIRRLQDKPGYSGLPRSAPKKMTL
jgi:hypothetical protein